MRADTFYLTVAGLGGEPEYEQRFSGWAKDLDKILNGRAARQGEYPVRAGRYQGQHRSQAARPLRRSPSRSDSLVLMLIGHGSFDESDYKFNMPGPDISATELAALLDKIPAHQLIVNMTSASGGAMPLLQNQKAEARDHHRHQEPARKKMRPYFARYWIEALRDPAADTDKNEVITALEAFRYAEEKTAKFYETQKRLATEHALIEDTGKGEGVKAPSPENGEGLMAGRFALLHLGAVAAHAQRSGKAEAAEA